jgi:hypothetical protein
MGWGLYIIIHPYFHPSPEKAAQNTSKVHLFEGVKLALNGLNSKLKALQFSFVNPPDLLHYILGLLVLAITFEVVAA